MTVLEDILSRIEATRRIYTAIWERDNNYSIEKAIRNAKRKNKKADEKAPLLAYAGLVKHITPEELKEKYDNQNRAYAQQIIDGENERAKKASELVKKIASLVSETELLEMEKYRVRVYSDNIVYDLEYWRKILKELEQNNN